VSAAPDSGVHGKPSVDGRLAKALAAVDAANAEDPNRVETEGGHLPAELVYGRRMSEALARLEPNPSDCLRIAARGQHVGRWRVPRRSFPEGRAGYLAWRKRQRELQAGRLGQIMAAVGYEAAQVDRVSVLIRKERLHVDPEVQMLEDVICVVFLDHYFNRFAADKEEDQLANILAKTWMRMSEHGRAEALRLDVPAVVTQLLARGLGGRRPAA
jgi:hypothetical protein